MRTRILGGERSDELDVGHAHPGQELCSRWIEWSETSMTLGGQPRTNRTCVMTEASF